MRFILAWNPVVSCVLNQARFARTTGKRVCLFFALDVFGAAEVLIVRYCFDKVETAGEAERNQAQFGSATWTRPDSSKMSNTINLYASSSSKKRISDINLL
jgi:hypothetical protein